MSTAIEVSIPSRAERLPGGVAEVGLLAYPVVLQTLSDTAMQVVDSAIVGRLGITELGALGFGGIWLWTMLTIFVGAATGVQTFVARAYGAGERGTCGRWAWQGVYVLLVPASLWTVMLLAAFEPALNFSGASPELRSLATAYARARLLGAPALIAAVAFTAFFRGIGDTRTPLLATVIANVLNAFAAYGLVFGRFGLPAWGVAGAGAATALSNWTYSAIMLVCLLRPRTAAVYGTRPVRPDPVAMRRYARTSAPIGGQWLLDMCSFALFSTIIARMGNAAMAASQAMIQLLSLSFMQAFGISIAAGALVGRYLGARDLEAAERSYRSAMKLGFVLAAGVAVLFCAVPELLLGVFTRDPEVLALGRPLLALGAVFQLVDAAGIIVGGALRGAGDTRWPFVVQASLAWLVRLPLVYVAAVVLRGGVTGAWWGELGYIIVLGSVFLLRFQRGAWKHICI
jgi:multidrug resistance protein, MATE family